MTNVRRITAQELKRELDRGASVVIVDTRSGAAFRRARLPGAFLTSEALIVAY